MRVHVNLDTPVYQSAVKQRESSWIVGRPGTQEFARDSHTENGIFPGHRMTSDLPSELLFMKLNDRKTKVGRPQLMDTMHPGTGYGL